MTRTWLMVAIAVAGLGLLAPNAQAGIASVGSGVTDVSGNPPSNTGQGQSESSTNVRVFAEQTGFTSGIAVDVTSTNTVHNSTSTLSSTTLASGPKDSYYLHHDPVGTSPAVRISSRIVFDVPILGVTVRTSRLDSTNSTAGHPSVTYTTGGNHGLELNGGPTAFNPLVLGSGNGDAFLITTDRLTFSFSVNVSNGVDHIRIITAPEPGTIALFAFGLAGVAGAGWLRRRRKRRRG